MAIAATDVPATPATLPSARLTSSPKWWQRFLRNPRVVVGLTLITVLYLVALLAPVLAPHDPNAQVLLDRLKPPSPQHWLGTDQLGRDVLSRAIWAARVSLGVSLVATAITVVVGTLVGMVAGYFGGWADQVLMRTVDVFLSFPVFILLITIVAIYGASVWLLIVFLGLVSWPETARVVRADVLSLARREFALAARVIGADHMHVMLRHLLPNVVPVLVVAATLRVAVVILVEAGLSYFGLGVPPPAPSWGNMVSDGKLLMGTAWWITTFPGALVVISVLAYNLLGDGLRDVLDPRRR
jgi:peptide/nickel transport system permease protein